LTQRAERFADKPTAGIPGACLDWAEAQAAYRFFDQRRLCEKLYRAGLGTSAANAGACGNSYWVSDLEGGKVYQIDSWDTRDTDSGTRCDGPPHNYIHFEGQNPAHPSEHMREISSYDLKKMNR
jgi:hypothetical protein